MVDDECVGMCAGSVSCKCLDGTCKVGSGGGASTCEKDDDCKVDGVCPVDAAKGCGCLSIPSGAMLCIALCETTADCPTVTGDSALICKDKGCHPEQAGGAQCTQPEDCKDKCPGAATCTCDDAGKCKPEGGGGGASCNGDDADCDPCPFPKGCVCMMPVQKCAAKCEDDSDCPNDFLCDADGKFCSPPQD